MQEKPQPAHPHEKHRERMRSLFLQSGLDGFSDHNVLELLLFYTIPKRDTNITAHALIDTFGSLQGVLDAPVEELVKVKGVGMYTATFLSLMPQLAKKYSAGKLPDSIFLSEPEAVRSYVRSLFIGETAECAYLLSFGANGQRLGCTKVSLGTATQLQLDRRSLLEAAFRTNAVQVVLTHNHPEGVAVPSSEDVRCTREIANLFAGVDIRLADHIIVAGEDCFSMASHARFKALFI